MITPPGDRRARPDDFLELVERARRGLLKVYIGFAAGVGKTWQMLEEAHALKRRGVDVVLAFIETHGRAEVAALLEGLEQIPRKKYQYRGVELEEMDLDAVLARKPQVAIVDEVAHTNVPLARHRKRFQDILELLDAGINVICAFNIQHLESLHDLLQRVTGVVVRETIPDSFLHQADQVVNIDLAVEDLLDRLRSGRIYPKDKVPRALEHFFREANLASLRELALRQVAESLDRTFAARAGPASRRWRAGTDDRVMVCMPSYSPIAQELLRVGCLTAGRLNTEWYVVYIETPGKSPERMPPDELRHLTVNIEAARELGAEVVRLRARDVVPAIVDFARSHRVGHIIIGRSHRSRWRQRLGMTTAHRLLNAVNGVDLHIVSSEDGDQPT